MRSYISRSAVALPVAVILGLSGCATQGGLAGASDTASNNCDPVIGAVIGGILGGLIDSNRRGRGAAIGAGLGALACVAINAITKQTRTAEQVEADYRAKNEGSLPTETKVEGYNTTIIPSNTVQPGGKFQVISTIDVIQGTQVPIKEIRERVTLFRPDNTSQALGSLEKVATQKAASGTFENTFSFTFPQGVPQGSYPVQSVVYLNGQEVEKRTSQIQVVTLGTGALIALQSR